MAARRRRATPPPEDDGWHLDKRVPIALIIMMVVQLMGVVATFTSMQGDINNNRRGLVTMQSAGATRDEKLERLISVERDVTHIRDVVGKMERKIDRLTENDYARRQDIRIKKSSR